MNRSNCGYEIIDSISIGQIEIVLGKNARNHYVTWHCRKNDYYNHGNYFNDQLCAKKDMYERVIKEINLQKELLVKHHPYNNTKEVSR